MIQTAANAARRLRALHGRTWSEARRYVKRPRRNPVDRPSERIIYGERGPRLHDRDSADLPTRQHGVFPSRSVRKEGEAINVVRHEPVRAIKIRRATRVYKTGL